VSWKLLDSDCVIDYLRGVQAVIDLVRGLDQSGDVVCTCDVVIAEVCSGLLPGDRARGYQVLAALEFLPTSAAAAQQAGEWRYSFARTGRTLSPTDCIIAAVAYAHGASLVTGNPRDFPMDELTLVPLPRSGLP
jgi:predicted nucleic acid-binding protein